MTNGKRMGTEIRNTKGIHAPAIQVVTRQRALICYTSLNKSGSFKNNRNTCLQTWYFFVVVSSFRASAEAIPDTLFRQGNGKTCAAAVQQLKQP